MGQISGRAAFGLCGGLPDEACEGRDFRSFDAEAVADEFVERQFQFHTGFGEAQHDVAGVAAAVADGFARDFPFRGEGANVVFGSVFDKRVASGVFCRNDGGSAGPEFFLLGLDAALKMIADREGTATDRLQQIGLALEQARYEASRAHRQYNAVDPENRLIVGDLERR